MGEGGRLTPLDEPTEGVAAECIERMAQEIRIARSVGASEGGPAACVGACRGVMFRGALAREGLGPVVTA